MDVMYAIVKVYATERNDALKCHSNVITIWQTSAFEVTALFENLCSEVKDVQGNESVKWPSPGADIFYIDLCRENL